MGCEVAGSPPFQGGVVCAANRGGEHAVTCRELTNEVMPVINAITSSSLIRSGNHPVSLREPPLLEKEGNHQASSKRRETNAAPSI